MRFIVGCDELLWVTAKIAEKKRLRNSNNILTSILKACNNKRFCWSVRPNLETRCSVRGQEGEEESEKKISPRVIRRATSAKKRYIGTQSVPKNSKIQHYTQQNTILFHIILCLTVIGVFHWVWNILFQRRACWLAHKWETNVRKIIYTQWNFITHQEIGINHTFF